MELQPYLPSAMIHTTNNLIDTTSSESEFSTNQSDGYCSDDIAFEDVLDLLSSICDE